MFCLPKTAWPPTSEIAGRGRHRLVNQVASRNWQTASSTGRLTATTLTRPRPDGPDVGDEKPGCVVP